MTTEKSCSSAIRACPWPRYGDGLIAAIFEIVGVQLDFDRNARHRIIRWRRRRRGRLCPVVFVFLSFFNVGKNVVGFADLLESFFGVLVLWIAVWMQLEGEFPICTADLIHRRFRFDAQEGVCIHASQKSYHKVIEIPRSCVR